MSNEKSYSTSGSVGDLRVVVFSDSFRHRNGVGAYYCDLIDFLRDRVGAIKLVCPGLTAKGKAQGLSIPLPGDSSQRLCLPGLLKAYRAMRELRPHIVIVASPGPYGLLGAFLARRFNAKLCFGYHTQYDQLTELYWNRVFGALGKRYLAWLDRRFFRWSSAVFTNGKNMIAAAERMGARKIKLIGTPVERSLIKNPPVAIDREQFGPALFVGRLAPEKNLPKILEAARELPEIPFVVAGAGPLAGEVEKAAAVMSNLDYVGWGDRAELLNLLDQRCEMLLLPSQMESFGTVAAEAMARGRTALVSNKCGIIDWPELAGGLEVVDVDKPLAPRIKQLAALPVEQRRERCRTARDCCVKFVEQTITDWLDAFGEVVHGTR